jgi:predicted ArsR family transcriptional regulator
VRQARGRPQHAWRVHPDARPRGRPPEALADLGRWLTRALSRGDQLAQVEATGREIGRELAADAADRALAGGLHDALSALGFAPRTERTATGLRCELRNCPYREAVAENPAVVCTLHRGLTRGLLDRLAPTAQLTSFVARDPFAAGCVVEVAA